MTEELIYNLTIKQGEDYSVDFSYTEDDETPVDMTGWGIEAVIRDFPEANDFIPFTCTADETGFHLKMSRDLTNELTYSRGYYDLFITDPDNDNRVPLVSGRVSIIPRTSR